MLDENEMQRMLEAQNDALLSLKHQLRVEKWKLSVLSGIIEDVYKMSKGIMEAAYPPDMPPIPFHPFTLKNGGDR